MVNNNTTTQAQGCLSTVRQTSSRWSIGAAEFPNKCKLLPTLGTKCLAHKLQHLTKGLVTWVQGTITMGETLFQTMFHDSATQFDWYNNYIKFRNYYWTLSALYGGTKNYRRNK
jgi:hypothetical protein